MDTAKIEITKDEAQLIGLLPQVPVSGTIANAAQLMKMALTVQGLLEKVKVAFEQPEEKEAADSQ